MATAKGKITTARLEPGTQILAKLSHGAPIHGRTSLMVASTKAGSTILTVERVGSAGSGQREVLGTLPDGTEAALRCHGHNTHFLATKRDHERIENEPRAQEDGASVLAGVVSESAAKPGAAKVVPINGRRPAKSKTAKPRAPRARWAGLANRNVNTALARHHFPRVSENGVPQYARPREAADNFRYQAAQARRAGKTAAYAYWTNLAAALEALAVEPEN